MFGLLLRALPSALPTAPPPSCRPCSLLDTAADVSLVPELTAEASELLQLHCPAEQAAGKVGVGVSGHQAAPPACPHRGLLACVAGRPRAGRGAAAVTPAGQCRLGGDEGWRGKGQAPWRCCLPPLPACPAPHHLPLHTAAGGLARGAGHLARPAAGRGQEAGPCTWHLPGLPCHTHHHPGVGVQPGAMRALRGCAGVPAPGDGTLA